MDQTLCSIPDTLSIDEILLSPLTCSDLLSEINSLIADQGYRYVTARRPSKINPVFRIQCDHHGKKTLSSFHKSECKHQITFKPDQVAYSQFKIFWKIDWYLTLSDLGDRMGLIKHNHGPKSVDQVHNRKGKGKSKREVRRKGEHETDTNSAGYDEEEERRELPQPVPSRFSSSSSSSSTSTALKHASPSTVPTHCKQSSMQTRSDLRAKAKDLETASGKVNIEDYDGLIRGEADGQTSTDSSSSTQTTGASITLSPHIGQSSSSIAPAGPLSTENNNTSSSSNPKPSKNKVNSTYKAVPFHPNLSSTSQSGSSSSSNHSRVSKSTPTEGTNTEKLFDLAGLTEVNKKLHSEVEKWLAREESNRRTHVDPNQVNDQAKIRAEEQSRILKIMIEDLHAQNLGLKSDLQAERSQKDGLKSDMKEMEERNTALEERVAILDDRLATEVTANNVLKGEYRKKEEENKLLTENDRILIDKMESERNRYAYEIRLQVQNDDRQTLQKDLEASRKEFEKLKAENQELKIEKEEFRSKNEKLESEKEELANANEDFKRRIKAQRELKELEVAEAKRVEEYLAEEKQMAEEAKKIAEEASKRKRAREVEKEEMERKKRKLLEDINEGEEIRS